MECDCHKIVSIGSRHLPLTTDPVAYKEATKAADRIEDSTV